MEYIKNEIMEKNGAKFAVIPIAEYNNLVSLKEDIDDATDAADIIAKIRSGTEETFPSDFADKLIAAENTGQSIKLWRDFRGITQQNLADKSSVTREHVSQIECGKRDGTIKVIKALAEALAIDINDII